MFKVMKTHIESTAAFEHIVAERLSADEIVTFTFYGRLSVTIHHTPVSLLTGRLRPAMSGPRYSRLLSRTTEMLINHLLFSSHLIKRYDLHDVFHQGLRLSLYLGLGPNVTFLHIIGVDMGISRGSANVNTPLGFDYIDQKRKRLRFQMCLQRIQFNYCSH